MTITYILPSQIKTCYQIRLKVYIRSIYRTLFDQSLNLGGVGLEATTRTYFCRMVRTNYYRMVRTYYYRMVRTYYYRMVKTYYYRMVRTYYRMVKTYYYKMVRTYY